MRDFAAFMAMMFGLRRNRIHLDTVYKGKYPSACTKRGPSDSTVALSMQQLGHEETDKSITGDDNSKLPFFRGTRQYTCASHSTNSLNSIQRGYSVAKPCRKHHLTTSHVDLCLKQGRSKEDCPGTYKALIRLVLRRP